MPDMMRACFCVISSSYHNVFSLTPFGSVSLTWFTHTLTPSMSKSICLLIYHHLPHFFSISSVCPASPQVNPRHARKVSPEKTVISCCSEENGFTHGYSLCFGDTSVYGCVLTEKKAQCSWLWLWLAQSKTYFKMSLFILCYCLISKWQTIT